MGERDFRTGGHEMEKGAEQDPECSYWMGVRRIIPMIFRHLR
jgi:hypothetical protein